MITTPIVYWVYVIDSNERKSAFGCMGYIVPVIGALHAIGRIYVHCWG